MAENHKHWEPLGNGIEVLVSDNHTFGTDTVLLAAFAKPKAKDTVCELGTGCGTIPLIWCRQNPPKHITAVDISTEACELLQCSIEKNGFQEKITVLNENLCFLDGKIPKSNFDLVVCNPPYKAEGTGIKNPVHSHTVARHEEMCRLEDIAACASALLNFGGRFCLCQRPERLSDVIEVMRQYAIEPKRLRFVQQRPDKAPKLFLIEGRRSGRRGSLVIEPVLMIENGQGGLSDEMIEIYGSYKEGHL
ncbi:MAG: tRNA1(Val) (adenine(37)-N6)-methyltransferase [Acutalibacteraceae bacterium]